MLQIDHNPLEWPPRRVIEPLENSVDDPDALQSHLENLRKWLQSPDNGSPMSFNRVQGQLQQQEGVSLPNSQPNNISDTDVARHVFF